MIRDLMIGGVSVEDMLGLWASALREGKRRLRPLFTQERVAGSAGQFLDALLGNEPRKTGWMRAEAAGDKGPWRQQALLGRGRWDADALRDIVRDHVIAHLGEADGQASAVPTKPQPTKPISNEKRNCSARLGWVLVLMGPVGGDRMNRSLEGQAMALRQEMRRVASLSVP